MKKLVKITLSVVFLSFLVVSANAQDFDDFDDEIILESVKDQPGPEDDEPLMVAEIMPAFQNGDLRSFQTWVMSNLKYPIQAMDQEIEGRVVAQFVVEQTGDVTNVEILSSPHDAFSEEVMRVISSSPRWTPGSSRNKPVRVKYTLPVSFKFQ